MSDPSLALQAELVARLKAYAAVSALITDRVYDTPPVGATYPYVTLGESQVLPDKADCFDGVECFVQIDAWSRKQSFAEVKTLAGAILDALDEVELNLSGFQVIVFAIERIDYLRDPDGLTRHAALTFRGLIQTDESSPQV